MFLQSDVRALLVHACQTAITGDIGCEMAVSRRTNCSPVNSILPLMRKAFNLARSNRAPVSRSSGTYMKLLAPSGLKYYRPQCMFLPPESQHFAR